MTHDEALEAARTAAANISMGMVVDKDQLHDLRVRTAIAAYLAAFGVRDMGALVEAARDARDYATDYPPDEPSFCARIDAALTPPAGG